MAPAMSTFFTMGFRRILLLVCGRGHVLRLYADERQRRPLAVHGPSDDDAVGGDHLVDALAAHGSGSRSIVPPPMMRKTSADVTRPGRSGSAAHTPAAPSRLRPRPRASRARLAATTTRIDKFGSGQTLGYGRDAACSYGRSNADECPRIVTVSSG
jgi:hypothetical protein